MFSMEEMLSKKNQREAFSFLKNKKDGMGADGMPLSELEDYWKINSERIVPTARSKISSVELIAVKFPFIQKTPCFSISSTFPL